MPLLLSLLLTIITTLCAIYLLKPLAEHIGLLDLPGGRKQHEQATPLIGGLAIFLGVIVGFLALPIGSKAYLSFFSGCALLVLVGVLDDLHEISSKKKLFLQILAALFMVAWGGVALHDLGNLLFWGNITLGNWSIPLTLLAVIGIINAINMMDGMDGLAGGMSAVSVLLLMVLAVLVGDATSIQILSLLLAAVITFLCFNFPFSKQGKAKVFMGDAGSMLLGFALAWFLVSLSQGETPAASPAVMLWIVTVPLFDMLRVTLLRFKRKVPLFSPDREHIHHLLVRLGCSHRKVTSVLCLTNLFFGFLAIMAYYTALSDAIIFTTYIMLFFVYLWGAGRIQCRAL